MGGRHLGRQDECVEAMRASGPRPFGPACCNSGAPLRTPDALCSFLTALNTHLPSPNRLECSPTQPVTTALNTHPASLNRPRPPPPCRIAAYRHLLLRAQPRGQPEEQEGRDRL